MPPEATGRHVGGPPVTAPAGRGETTTRGVVNVLGLPFGGSLLPPALWGAGLNPLPRRP